MASTGFSIGMYMVRESMAANLCGTLRALRDFGYTGIEFYGEPIWDPATVSRALRDFGLGMTGWHIEWRHLQPHTLQQTVDYLARMECPIAVVPCLGGPWSVGHTPDLECRQIWVDYAARMNQICASLSKRGIRLAYHNHAHEFQLRYDGQTVFDLLFCLLDQDVLIELDTGNCIEGGSDPVQAMEAHPDRDLLLHLKPYSSALGFDVSLGGLDDENNWSSILSAAQNRCLRFIVESESTLLPELENAHRSLKALNTL